MTSLYGSRRREARAINSLNLSWTSSGCSDVDYLAARGMSRSTLGATLERLKYGQDSSVYRACVGLLSDKFSRCTRRAARLGMVHAALHEFLDDQCRACRGGTPAYEDDRESVCDVCQGSGKRQYSAAERAQASSVKLSSWRHHESDYTALLDCIHRAVHTHRKGLAMALADS